MSTIRFLGTEKIAIPESLPVLTVHAEQLLWTVVSKIPLARLGVLH